MSEQNQPPLKIAGDGETPSGGRILIIEDDPDVRVTLVDLLEDAGYPVDCAANGQEALDHLRRGTLPSVILLDLMMPVMDGWEFRREQRRDPRVANVPVIVLSALDRTRVGDLGEAAFMKKPLDFDRLLELVRRYCT
jgi:CheY-like chemotaxis protein